jgi:transcriptional regulator GlxA family with amidase domain
MQTKHLAKKDKTSSGTDSPHAVENWPKPAELANWSVGELAKLCGVSVQQLQEQFQIAMAKPTDAWFTSLRQRRADSPLTTQFPTSRLLHITKDDWREMAKTAEYQVRRLAKLCGISVRSLQRHFPDMTGTRPQQWLNGERMRLAGELLARGLGVLEVRNQLAFKSAAHFSRSFKQHFGHAPREHAGLVRNGTNPGRDWRALASIGAIGER